MKHHTDLRGAPTPRAVEPFNGSSPSEFDWQALVIEAFPGTSAAAPREQLARATRMQDLLIEWSSPFGAGLIKQFIRPSVLFAVASTPRTASDDLTLSLARLIYWIYSLDTALDALDAHDDDSAILLLRLAATPLIEQLGADTFRRYGWNIEAQSDTATHGVTPYLRPGAAREIATVGPLLADALRALVARAAHARVKLASAEGVGGNTVSNEFFGQLTMDQLTQCVCALRQELLWSPTRRRARLAPPRLRNWPWDTGRGVRLRVVQRSTTSPSLEAYLAIAERTTGVHPTAALICWLTFESEHVWLHAQHAIQTAARVVRLANDLHGARQDHAQGHFTALTAALPRHGLWSRFHRCKGERVVRLVHETILSHPLTISTEIAHVTRSRRIVVRELESAIAHFASASAHLDPGLLTYYLRHMVAAALARYTTILSSS